MINKTVLIYANVGISYPSDHYGIARNEGRIPTNIGFGLMELGYDVNIVSPNFKEIMIDRHSSLGLNSDKGCVRLSREAVYKEYDFSLTWGATPFDTKIKKEINYINYGHEIRGITKLASTFVTPYKQLVKYMTEESRRPVEYLPPLVPISTYHLGFKEFNYKLPTNNGNNDSDDNRNNNINDNRNDNSNSLKIFVYVSSWERTVLCLREYEIILEEIKLIMKRRDIKIKLFIQVDSESMKRDIRSIMRLSDDIEFVGKFNYDDYLRLIENMDILIIKGTQFMASAGMYDIISLGKPMLYVSEKLHEGIFRNPLFENTKEIIFSDDNELSIRRKVDDFILNPRRKYEIFRKSLEDSDFKNWKEFALKIFN